MGKIRGTFAARGALSFGDRVKASLRPSVEAALLVAVALGVAQAGWSMATPDSAGASSGRSTNDPIEPASENTAASAEFVSPFAPALAGVDAQSHAIAAALSGLQLSGVRLSESLSSGAVLTMADGAQRAFSVGDEVTGGVRLADVGANYVLLQFDGGQRQLTMAAPPTFSYARALMGQAQDAPPPPDVVLGGVSSAVAQAPQMPRDLSWLAAALGASESVSEGWRVGAEVPNAVTAAGLQPGDVIVAVNGSGPNDIAAALNAVSSGHAELTVQRGVDRLTISVGANRPT